ncbi:hypothetical protein PHLGIDRAFT_17190 [Phlebiopsis gigantea 11061_1 CR5-6]|uniref:Uncharacterized protein n=1 Tax=Phlebiopsis gigantea (strain 11061_1 CR5-6) TaxID=745531 RepID=A0A0C3RPK0_PHLG1|nr:hypothetical protein PHLGIDRAFT_17190 [Phlebiopsis gigantea 11061_1 CR5-6]
MCSLYTSLRQGRLPITTALNGAGASESLIVSPGSFLLKFTYQGRLSVSTASNGAVAPAWKLRMTTMSNVRAMQTRLSSTRAACKGVNVRVALSIITPTSQLLVSVAYTTTMTRLVDAKTTPAARLNTTAGVMASLHRNNHSTTNFRAYTHIVRTANAVAPSSMRHIIVETHGDRGINVPVSTPPSYLRLQSPLPPFVDEYDSDNTPTLCPIGSPSASVLPIGSELPVMCGHRQIGFACRNAGLN